MRVLLKANKRGVYLGLLALIGVFSTSLLADSSTSDAPVRLGIDMLEAQGFAPLVGKQVGLVTNPSGVDSRGRATADILANAPGVKLVALFSPEHGIRGTVEGGESIRDSIDHKTHCPVYSLYGSTQRPSPEMLNAIDVMVFDLQDVGARYYTYLTTMGMVMEETARRHIDFIVLDRPNPVGGDIVAGQVLDPQFRDFTAYYSVPVRHGLTAGEMAEWYNNTAKLGAHLNVIRMTGWKRSMLWPDTCLPFIRPSPSIQTPTAALLYCGLGMFEATNISVGRGTEKPFQYIGAPWIKGKNFYQRVKALEAPGIKWQPVEFIPSKDRYAGQLCTGVEITVRNPDLVRPVDLFVRISMVLRELYPNDFILRWPEVARVTGSRDFENLYAHNGSADDVLKIFHASADQFKKDRQPYLLY